MNYFYFEYSINKKQIVDLGPYFNPKFDGKLSNFFVLDLLRLK